MAEEEKKRGLFGRLFGKKQSQPGEETPKESSEIVVEEAVDALPESLPDSLIEESRRAEGVEPGESIGLCVEEISAREVVQSESSEFDSPEQLEIGQELPRRDEFDGSFDERFEDEILEIPVEKGAGIFGRLRKGLSKTRSGIAKKMDRIFFGKKEIDAETLDELEEALVTADLGVHAAMKLIEGIREKVGRKELADQGALRAHLKGAIAEILLSHEPEFDLHSQKPFVVLVVGVNGVGKTTTIGKIASQYSKKGCNVLLAAGDTFRAAAIEQLEIWGQRTGSRVVRHQHGSDAAAVAYDAVESAKAKNVDLAIIDTAGRLHTKSNLMEELKKIKRVMGKVIPGAPHHVLLVLDSTTGQNAVNQARIFNEAVGVDSIAITKLDGTAKGGVVVGICDELGLPIQFVGVGEQIEDLCPFDREAYIDALF